MISAIKVDLEDNGLGGVHHRTLRSLGWLNYKTSNGSKPKRCQHSSLPSRTRRVSTCVCRPSATTSRARIRPRWVTRSRTR